MSKRVILNTILNYHYNISNLPEQQNRKLKEQLHTSLSTRRTCIYLTKNISKNGLQSVINHGLFPSVKMGTLFKKKAEAPN